MDTDTITAGSLNEQKHLIVLCAIVNAEANVKHKVRTIKILL